jgi:hypothetical protein
VERERHADPREPSHRHQARRLDLERVDFEADDARAEHLAPAFSAAFDQPGWYVNFSARPKTFVIYPGRVFRYRRGDRDGRAEAQTHGRALGVPEPQLAWTEWPSVATEIALGSSARPDWG